jgi:UDP-N-acetylmuramoylalanine--D-glutamate ligase
MARSGSLTERPRNKYAQPKRSTFPANTIGRKILGVAGETITQAISQFKGLEHRLEFVAEINGARYFNDSYSTAPDATEVAIEAFHEPKILILGGASKESDFAPLGKLISNSKSIKAIIGIGVEWPRIRSHINNPTIKIIEGCDTMAEIVNAAQTAASAGDVVLLSPGCASFGMFKNYTSRGEQFKEAVRQLKKQ